MAERKNMWIKSRNTNAVEISSRVIDRVLSMYPEEELISRPVFQKAFERGWIDFDDLKKESEKILVPWQMFLLTQKNLSKQLRHIEAQRQSKVSQKLLAKRPGVGKVTSKRIIDRLIRQQNYVVEKEPLSQNSYCGSLKQLSVKAAAAKISKVFNIDPIRLQSDPGKGKALEYLVSRVEANAVNVCRGVLAHKLLPNHRVVPSNVYRNTSGFAIRDERLPFIFLPGESNPDEVESRQIYTLVYLLVVIGLDKYEYILDKDLKGSLLNAGKQLRRIHAITTELLIPSIETEILRSKNVTVSLRDQLSARFKVSPTALITTLYIRGIISKPKYEELLPPSFVPRTNSEKLHLRSPKITTAVRKSCGSTVFEVINRRIASKALTNIQAQYLIFGAVNKKGFQNYRTALNI